MKSNNTTRSPLEARGQAQAYRPNSTRITKTGRAAINEAARPYMLSFVQWALKSEGRKQGHGWMFLAPNRIERTPSFFLDSDGSSHDYGTGEHCSDCLATAAFIRGVELPAAKAELLDFCGSPAACVSVSSWRPEKAPAVVVESKSEPCPRGAERLIPAFLRLRWVKDAWHATGAHWIYRNLDGGVLGFEFRCQPSKEKKAFRCAVWTGPTKWRSFKGLTFMMLYGLERLKPRPKAPILIVEGARTADAGQGLFRAFRVLGMAGRGRAHSVEIEPLQGIQAPVYLWPDADADNTGQKAMHSLAERLTAQGNEVYVVEPPAALLAWCKPGKDTPGGWDLADPAPEGIDIHALLKGAKRWGKNESR
jgi:hypothetical protein